jgi:hypothetical protein
MTATITAFDRVVAALEAHGSRLVHRQRGIMAQCPVHADRNPSLGVTETDGRVLVKCYAGCETTDVLAALGLAWGDLFDKSATPAGDDRPTRKQSRLPEWAKDKIYGPRQ